jgi:hypothetical protein
VSSDYYARRIIAKINSYSSRFFQNENECDQMTIQKVHANSPKNLISNFSSSIAFKILFWTNSRHMTSEERHNIFHSAFSEFFSQFSE